MGGYALAILRWAFLVLALVLPAFLGLAISYLLAIVLLFAVVTMLFTRASWRAHFDIAGKGFLVAFVALLLAFALSAHQPSDVRFAFNFTAFLAYIPFATVCAAGRHGQRGEKFAVLSLLGALLGCGIALYEVLVLHADRAGDGLTDPIRLADTTLILGFFALAGWQAFKNRWRWIFIIAPFAILTTIYFASARGALVAFPVCLLVALFMLVRNKLAAVGLCAVLVVGGVLVSTSSLTAWNGRMEALPGIVASLISGEELSDRSAQYRLELYQAGLRSFLDSPIFGHGWERLTSDPAQYLPEKYKFLQRLPHLHNEALDFLVAAGLLGLLVYIGLLALPIMACVRTPRDGLYPTRFYAAIMLSVTYFMLGLPDSMLAFEMHTMLFVAFTVIINAYVREKPSAINITSAP